MMLASLLIVQLPINLLMLMFAVEVRTFAATPNLVRRAIEGGAEPLQSARWNWVRWASLNRR